MVDNSAPGNEPHRWIVWLDSVRSTDVALVGGKAASLGELAHALAGTDAVLPRGFAVASDAYRAFLEQTGIASQVADTLAAVASKAITTTEAASRLQALIRLCSFPAALGAELRGAYRKLCLDLGAVEAPVAVRSSATMEDLPGISFAGQHQSFLGVQGEDALLRACQECFASLFTERAFAYREQMGLDHGAAALAVAVHGMVAWPDCEAAGVMFTLDTESGFPGFVNVTGNWGIGESVVQGAATPDEFLVFKPAIGLAPCPIARRRKGAKLVKSAPGSTAGSTVNVPTSDSERDAFCLSDEDVLQLASWATAIERHYGRPMDIEWAKEGGTGRLGIVQARPETVHGGVVPLTLRSFSLPRRGEPVVRGVAVGSGIVAGRTRVIRELAQASIAPGDILVTSSTSPDWVPVMQRAGGIVTDLGGRTSHAAIVSRELGIPAVVGTQNATSLLSEGTDITVSCAEGSEGMVYRGRLAYRVEELSLKHVPTTRTRVMLNLSIPEAALRWWRLPADGVGLARIEFVVGQQIGAHPMALLHPEQVQDDGERAALAALAKGYVSGAACFVSQLAEGIAQIAASQHPRPVVVRLSDFKSNEYASLLGGRWFEPPEPNPMLGLRGASRYYHPRYREAFALECQAIRRVRTETGLDNVVVMIPFCRTVPECDRVLEEMAAHGLVRGEDGLRVWLMSEIPSNAVLAGEFASRVDGFSIGSNDLTQLVLGVDRDSAELRALFSEKDPAVKAMIRMVIESAHAQGITVSFCGQAPSDDPAFAEFLVECGIDSISVTPDTLLRTREAVARAEAPAQD